VNGRVEQKLGSKSLVLSSRFRGVDQAHHESWILTPTPQALFRRGRRAALELFYAITGWGGCLGLSWEVVSELWYAVWGYSRYHSPCMYQQEPTAPGDFSAGLFHALGFVCDCSTLARFRARANIYRFGVLCHHRMQGIRSNIESGCSSERGYKSPRHGSWPISSPKKAPRREAGVGGHPCSSTTALSTLK
jgi:hypothetical protein